MTVLPADDPSIKVGKCLVAAVSLARFLRDHGRSTKARRILATIYG